VANTFDERTVCGQRLAFDPKSRRIFVAHTGRDSVELIDHDTRRHIDTLPGFKEAAGVVAELADVLSELAKLKPCFAAQYLARGPGCIIVTDVPRKTSRNKMLREKRCDCYMSKRICNS
jgi:hypothetical protein